MPVRTSGRGGVLHDVPADPALVVATPGAEPHAAGGYAAALLLDGDALLARPGLRSAEEAFRRWLRAAALVKTGPDGGAVVVVADAAAPAVQALVRWDPAGLAARELSDRATWASRQSLARSSSPAKRPTSPISCAWSTCPNRRRFSDPFPDRAEGHQQLLVRAPRSAAATLTAAIKVAQGIRAARRSGGPVRVRVDPVDLG